jgi:hypothetical protein
VICEPLLIFDEPTLLILDPRFFCDKMTPTMLAGRRGNASTKDGQSHYHPFVSGNTIPSFLLFRAFISDMQKIIFHPPWEECLGTKR